MNKYAVIMAGGKGERFWPESRENRPKQMLSLFSSRTLIEQTVLRLHEFVPYENILIITNRDHAEPLRRLLPQLPPGNIIGEPARRDTAPCIALAAGIIQARDPEGLMTVFPADHVITDVANFTADLDLACANAADSLVTIGIAPPFPVLISVISRRRQKIRSVPSAGSWKSRPGRLRKNSSKREIFCGTAESSCGASTP